MKHSFDFSLSGRDWWAPFLVFWVVFLAAYAAELATARFADSRPGLYLLVNILFLVLVVVLESIFTIVIMRIILPCLSLDGHPFGFSGSVGPYLGLNIKGILLTIITLSIYAPWYVRRIAAYLSSHTSWKGVQMEFLGKPGRLFKYFLLGLYLPIIVMSVGMAIVAISVGGQGRGAAGSQLAVSLSVLLVFLILIPFMYLTYKWYVDVKWGAWRARWETKFWQSCGMVLGQLLLSLVTLGIYAPAAAVRCCRYFVDRTVLQQGEDVAARCAFSGGIGQGFGLLWGQGLLCLVTLGIYYPWAYARIGRWFARATTVEPARPA